MPIKGQTQWISSKGMCLLVCFSTNKERQSPLCVCFRESDAHILWPWMPQRCFITVIKATPTFPKTPHTAASTVSRRETASLVLLLLWSQHPYLALNLENFLTNIRIILLGGFVTVLESGQRVVVQHRYKRPVWSINLFLDLLAQFNFHNEESPTDGSHGDRNKVHALIMRF